MGHRASGYETLDNPMKVKVVVVMIAYAKFSLRSSNFFGNDRSLLEICERFYKASIPINEISTQASIPIN